LLNIRFLPSSVKRQRLNYGDVPAMGEGPYSEIRSAGRLAFSQAD
jgi:hypothetical protein